MSFVIRVHDVLYKREISLAVKKSPIKGLLFMAICLLNKSIPVGLHQANFRAGRPGKSGEGVR